MLRSKETRRAPIEGGSANPNRKRNGKRKRIRKRKVNFDNKQPIIKIGKSNIKFKDSVRYLDVRFDRMKISSYCQYLSHKVETIFTRLGQVGKSPMGLAE